MPLGHTPQMARVAAAQQALPALLDHLVDVKLEGRHQDVVQGFWAALTSQKQVKAGLWKGGDPLSAQMEAETQGGWRGCCVRNPGEGQWGPSKRAKGKPLPVL